MFTGFWISPLKQFARQLKLCRQGGQQQCQLAYVKIHRCLDLQAALPEGSQAIMCPRNLVMMRITALLWGWRSVLVNVSGSNMTCFNCCTISHAGTNHPEAILMQSKQTAITSIFLLSQFSDPEDNRWEYNEHVTLIICTRVTLTCLRIA